MLTSKNGENGIRIAFSCPQDFPGARPHDVPKTPPDDPTTPQDDPTTAQVPQDAPNTPQDAPRTPPRRPKTAQDMQPSISDTTKVLYVLRFRALHMQPSISDTATLNLQHHESAIRIAFLCCAKTAQDI